MNRYEFTEEYVIGYTYNGIPFYIDIEDYDLVKPYQWYVKNNGYVFSSKTKTHEAMYLHRLIMGEPQEMVDHENRNKLDNRKYNLRLCNSSNGNYNRNRLKTNTTGYTGVSYNGKYYRSYIHIDGKFIHIGNYNNLHEAVVSRLKAEYKYYGEYAPQKNLFEKYQIGIDK